MIRAQIVADSVNPAGVRLTTFECVVPKWLIAEINTHAMIRRNSASSRAIPTTRIIEHVLTDPYVPLEWRYRAPEGGMQAGELMSDEDVKCAQRSWLFSRDRAVDAAYYMDVIKTAKEHVNRLLEPWMWSVVVMTATEWDQYIKQRGPGRGAQPEFQRLVELQLEAFAASEPVQRHDRDWGSADAWHLPYITELERESLHWRDLPRISAARCAGVSYYRPGARGSIEDEIARTTRLIANGHWSPLDMPCDVQAGTDWYGAYRGWKPLRKLYGGESGSTTHGTQEDAPWVLR